MRRRRLRIVYDSSTDITLSCRRLPRAGRPGTRRGDFLQEPVEPRGGSPNGSVTGGVLMCPGASRDVRRTPATAQISMRRRSCVSGFNVAITQLPFSVPGRPVRRRSRVRKDAISDAKAISTKQKEFAKGQHERESPNGESSARSHIGSPAPRGLSPTAGSLLPEAEGRQHRKVVRSS